MKPFSKKTKQELILELNIEFNGNLAQMADNYNRTVDELLSAMKTTKLKGLKVYEFYFKGSNKVHFAIAKSKKALSDYYLNNVGKIYLRKDIEIDETLGFADVITGDGFPAKTLEEILND